MEEENKNICQKLNDKIDEKLTEMSDNNFENTKIETLGMLVDIKKDIANMEYWKNKEEVMNMRRYRGDIEMDYGRRGVPGTGRRYRNDYGRRGVPGTGRRYRGEDKMEEMMDHYIDYNEASSDVYNGNYGAEDEMVKSVEGIMKNVYEIVEELTETDSPEVMHIIQKYAKKIQGME